MPQASLGICDDRTVQSCAMRCPRMPKQVERSPVKRRGGTRSARTIRSNGGAVGDNRETLKSIREWAKNNGHSVSDCTDCPPRCCRPGRPPRRVCSAHRPRPVVVAGGGSIRAGTRSACCTAGLQGAGELPAEAD